MTQYKDRVEYQRLRLAAEEWGEKVKYLMAQHGYLEIARNNGEITREHTNGEFEVVEEAMSINDVILHYPGIDV